MLYNNETLLEKAERLFPGHPYNKDQWLRAIGILGDKWICRLPVSKQASGFQQ